MRAKREQSKRISFLIVAVMMISLLGGCGKKTDTAEENTQLAEVTETAFEAVTQMETETETEAKIEAEIEIETESENGTELSTESEQNGETTQDEKTGQDEEMQVDEIQTSQEVVEVEQQAEAEAEQVRQIVVCIDPGHGGDGDRNHGVEREYNGTMVMEKTLTLVIAQKIKAYLETDPNITVVITRTGDYAVGIQDRVSYAQANNADLFVSIHINSSSTGSPDDHGCLAIVTQSHYQASGAKSADVYSASENLAYNILWQLNGLGIPFTSDFMADVNNGLLRRCSESGATYADGSAADYYGIISHATKAGIPACIVEHAFLSNESDYLNYLSDDAKLDALAQADVVGIRNYIDSNLR